MNEVTFELMKQAPYIYFI